MTNGWGPVEKDSPSATRSGDGTTITLNGTTYAKGLGAHAASDVRYASRRGCTRFKATVGRGRRGRAQRHGHLPGVRGRDQGLRQRRDDRCDARRRAIDVAITGASAASPRRHQRRRQHQLRPRRLGATRRIECGSGGGDDARLRRSRRRRRRTARPAWLPTSRRRATFSEAMAPSTLTTSTFTLVKQGQSTPVAASVSYARARQRRSTRAPTCMRARPTPRRSRAASGGAKDIAGNALAADVSWSFTTGTPGSTQLPHRPHLDLDDERLGAGGEGQVERRVRHG